MDKFLKITYHLGDKKINAYLKMPSPTYHYLKSEIELCLFVERNQPSCAIRTFWIDEDHDEIGIVNQCDYEIFMAKRSEHQHLHVAPVDMGNKGEQVTAAPTNSSATSNSASNQTKIPPAANSYDFAVHDRVECDACLMAPIIGFRYKCIQCPDYDLCENCESKHIHSEHMMVRMPTKNCPNVIETYITERNSGRRHGKRSKTSSCPFIKNGISVIIDDDAEATNSASGEKVGEQSSSSNGKERYHGRKHHRRHDRSNFFSHLYEMMHDLAEGGGAVAAAHAMGESATTATSNKGPQATTTTTTTSKAPDFENVANPIAAAAAAAAAAQIAAKEAHETAAKAVEIAAKVAHETALKAAKNYTENMTASVSTSSSAAEGGEKEKEPTEEKVDATTSPRDSSGPQPNSIPIIPSPSLESLAQFLDPQLMKTGVQILNNFSDMFAKMLDPMENSENNNTIYPNLRKNSTTSTKTSVSSNLNSLGNDMQCDGEESKQKDQTKDKTEENIKTGSEASSHVEVDDLGSDSENESVSESFVKVYTPLKENVSSPLSSKSATEVSSAQTTPPQTVEKSNIIDFVKLGEDLQDHIAQEAAKNSVKSVETTSDSVETAKEALTTVTSTAAASNPVVTTASTSISTTTLNTSTHNNSEEKRAIPVYHADQRINNAVNAMMSMGFSNEGAWLTQLLESVNGNISEALDLMSVAQRDSSR